MKISSIYPQSAIEKYTSTKRKNVVSAEKKQQVDKVELNEDAKIFSNCLKAAKESISADDISREKRISQIAGALKNDTYSVPGQDVAKKILGTDLN